MGNVASSVPGTEISLPAPLFQARKPNGPPPGSPGLCAHGRGSDAGTEAPAPSPPSPLHPVHRGPGAAVRLGALVPKVGGSH